MQILVIVSDFPGEPTPPWTPPLGPAGAGRVGVITRGGIVDPYPCMDLCMDLFMDPWMHPCMDPCMHPCMDSLMDALIIFSFQKGSTIPPRVITPTRPAPAGPDGAPPGKSTLFFPGGCISCACWGRSHGPPGPGRVAIWVYRVCYSLGRMAASAPRLSMPFDGWGSTPIKCQIGEGQFFPKIDETQNSL